MSHESTDPGMSNEPTEADLAAGPLQSHLQAQGQGLLFWLFKEGTCKRDIDTDVDVDTNSYFGCSEGVSKSVQVLLNGIEAVLALTLINSEPLGSAVDLRSWSPAKQRTQLLPRPNFFGACCTVGALNDDLSICAYRGI